MKKIIVTMALVAFTTAAFAGSDCCPSKKKEEKKDCPAQEGKCPAGGEKKPDAQKS